MYNNMTRPLTLEQMKVTVPSVFSEKPWSGTSENYRFFPTYKVVEGLMDNGFTPVKAVQSRTRIEGKQDFTRHLLRFRHNSLLDLTKGDEIPEIVLINSHDGTSSYKLMLGFFRVVCSNGLVVASSMVDEVKVRHSGKPDVIDNVIEGSYQLIDQAPVVTKQVEEFKSTILNQYEQRAFATAALELNTSSLDIDAKQILRARRSEDVGSESERDLWKTLNCVQENMIKGGILGTSEKGKLRRTRAIKSIDADTKLNRALWILAEEMKDARIQMNAA